MKKLIILLVLGMVVAGCATYSEKTNSQISAVAIVKTELASLNLQNPESDLEKNFIHGDKRFIGIYGFVLYCPGTQGVSYDFIKQYGIRTIDGTSDALENEEHIALQRAAIKYAERYNQELLRKLSERR
jgi:hypothetical protein